MKVLHIIGGTLNNGAAIGVLNLHRALIAEGIESKVLCYSGDVTEQVTYLKNNLAVAICMSFIKLFWSLLRKTGIIKIRPNYIVNFGLTGVPFLFIKRYIKSVDIVNLHWLGDTFSLSFVNKIDKPIVWTVRDMWPFTGSCHYSNDCEMYRKLDGCKECKAYDSNVKAYISERSIELKKAISTKVHYVGISRKITEQLDDSYITSGCNPTYISNLISSTDFNFLNYKTLKSKYGLDESKPVLLLGARNVKDEYKGYLKFGNYVRQLKSDIQVVVFGHGWSDLNEYDEFISLSIGRVNDVKLMNELYNLADLYVLPSLQEAFGKSLAEAQCSGTYVIAFDDTGCADSVFSDLSGKLVPNFDFELLLDEINRYMAYIDLMEPGELIARREKISASSKSILYSRNPARRYIDLYSKIIANKI